MVVGVDAVVDDGGACGAVLVAARCNNHVGTHVLSRLIAVQWCGNRGDAAQIMML
jgi:hypothetical protein